MALPHARNVHLAVIVFLGEVVALVENHLRGVVVQVDDGGALQQARDTRRVGLGLGGGADRDQQKEEFQVDSVARRQTAKLTPCGSSSTAISSPSGSTVGGIIPRAPPLPIGRRKSFKLTV